MRPGALRERLEAPILAQGGARAMSRSFDLKHYRLVWNVLTDICELFGARGGTGCNVPFPSLPEVDSGLSSINAHQQKER